MLTLVRGGRVIDPGNLDGIMDIVIEDGKIVEIKKDALTGGEDTELKIIDASG
jgi:dihydroorotase-like cyclic amidohydrolase